MSNKTLVTILGVVAVLIGLTVFALSNMGGSEQTKGSNQSQDPQSLSGNPDQQQPTPTPTPTQEQTTNASSTKTTMVELTVKNFGTIKIQLDSVNAPKTSANFEKLVSEGFYNNLTFHRIVPTFVIQGGDPDGTGMGGPGYTVPAEIKLPHKRGSIAMARTSDQINPKRESSGSQFYIALNDLPDLDGAYTVFGQVVEGMDVVDKIAQVKTDGDDKPITPVVIEKATVLK